VGFLVGFVGLYYRKWAFKHPGVFLVESGYINPEDSCRSLRDFLSKISKLLFKRAWFSSFYDVSLVSHFVLCASTVAHLCLQYALRFELRH